MRGTGVGSMQDRGTVLSSWLIQCVGQGTVNACDDYKTVSLMRFVRGFAACGVL